MAIGALAIAIVTFQRGVVAARDALIPGLFAGMSLGVEITFAVIASVVVAIVTLVAFARSSRGGAGKAVAKVTGPALAGAWAGYVAAIVVVTSHGPSVDTRGTMRIELGHPFGNVAEFAATCSSLVGDPNVLASIDADGPGYMMVSLRDPRTHDRSEWMISNFSYPKLLVLDLGADSSPGGLVEISDALYRKPDVIEVVDHTQSGQMTLAFQRRPDWTNPGAWPPTFTVRVDWTCPSAG